MSLSVKNITVTFPGIVALDQVCLTCEPKRIHAVLGANGSGKSTLVKVLTGVYHPDCDKDPVINIDGTIVKDIATPNAAQTMGIRVVHQETPLINSLSVAECVALFKGYPMRGKLINWKALYEEVDALFESYGIEINPRDLVGQLSASDRGMVAISIALGKDKDLSEVKALILDEADASIPEAEAEKFLQHVRRVANMGIPVIMVTHRLKEVKSICDDVTILNDGKLVFSGSMQGIDDSFIISKMLRTETVSVEGLNEPDRTDNLERLWKTIGCNKSEELSCPNLEVRDLVARNIDGISFTIDPGEVVGFIGVPDSGVNELPRLLGGDIGRKAGQIKVSGRELPMKLSPRKAISAGIMLQPTDRFKQGGIMTSSLRDNVLLPNEKNFWHNKMLAKKTMDQTIEVFDLHPPAPQLSFGKFSGGNQQKAIVGKWLQLRPKVFVLDDPTYGVDPVARGRIFSLVKEASSKGIAFAVFSTEPEQLVSICSRILVLRQGKIVQELKTEDGSLTRESIAGWCYA
ncbi:MAG TPA: sugar ABC transporter ATP-binding protein [Syntrophomonas sp.]|nr:sugar ABC transporter ATP-binding protein [Syntrophomonas sp.]